MLSRINVVSPSVGSFVSVFVSYAEIYFVSLPVISFVSYFVICLVSGILF